MKRLSAPSLAQSHELGRFGSERRLSRMYEASSTIMQRAAAFNWEGNSGIPLTGVWVDEEESVSEPWKLEDGGSTVVVAVL